MTIPLKSYECAYHRSRGPTVCPNNRKPRIESLDALVVDAIREQVLNPDAIRYVVEQAAKKVAEKRKARPDEPEKLHADVARLKKEIDRLVAAIATGKAEPLAQAIAEREERIRQLERELAEFVTPVELTDFDSKIVERDLRERLKRFGTLLADNVPRGRQALRKLLNGTMLLTPCGEKGYVLRGETRAGALLLPDPPNDGVPKGIRAVGGLVIPFSVEAA